MFDFELKFAAALPKAFPKLQMKYPDRPRLGGDVICLDFLEFMGNYFLENIK